MLRRAKAQKQSLISDKIVSSTDFYKYSLTRKSLKDLIIFITRLKLQILILTFYYQTI